MRQLLKIVDAQIGQVRLKYEPAVEINIDSNSFKTNFLNSLSSKVGLYTYKKPSMFKMDAIIAYFIYSVVHNACSAAQLGVW